MKKMKKSMCSVTRSVVPSLLASAFAGEHNKHKVENVTPWPPTGPVDLDVGDMQMVAEFEQQVVGVAVSASGRVFVSFPRNGIDTVKNSVEEVIENKAVAYPNEEINTLNTRRALDAFSFRAERVRGFPATRCGCWTWATSARARRSSPAGPNSWPST